MKVILLTTVPKIGKKDDIKEINEGYARNFLFPNKLATPATPTLIQKVELAKKAIRVEKEVQNDLLDRNLKQIEGVEIILKEKTNEKGSLFASIHKDELVKALKKQHHIDVAEEFILMPKPIKELGEHTIEVSIKNKKATFKLNIQKA